jgi:hypothetical protein
MMLIPYNKNHLNQREVFMSVTFTVEGKVIGQKKSLFSDWHIELPSNGESQGSHLRLCDLIRAVVLKEVEAFQSRQHERKLARIMSNKEIDLGLQSGKVDPGGRALAQTVNPEEAVSTAIQAFEDGLYFVFIDDVQQTELEGEVLLKARSNVLFVRLTALVGG